MINVKINEDRVFSQVIEWRDYNRITHLAAVNVGRVEEIEGQGGDKIDEKPPLQVVDSDAFAVAHHFTLSAHVSRPKVQNDIWGKDDSIVFFRYFVIAMFRITKLLMPHQGLNQVGNFCILYIENDISFFLPSFHLPRHGCASFISTNSWNSFVQSCQAFLQGI